MTLNVIGWLRGSQKNADAAPWTSIAFMSLSLCVATAALVWLSFITTQEWSRDTSLLLERRQAEALSLVSSAVNRDLRGAWTRVLVPFNTMVVEEDPPLTMLHLAAHTFARFPYPESLLVWKANPGGSASTYAFSRTDRQPSWQAGATARDEPFPVILTRDPPELREVVEQLLQVSNSKQQFAVLEVPIGDNRYQVIVHFIYYSTEPHRLLGFAAFTVNLQWVRTEYFGPLLKQVSRIGHFEDSLSLAVLDDKGATIAETGVPLVPTGGVSWSFPLLFVDASVLAPTKDSQVGSGEWSVRVLPQRDNTQLAALRAARDTRLLVIIAAAASALALLLTIRAVRAWALLASMKSEFVSNVTHELKTPVALVRLVGDTLASGRYASNETVGEYARLLLQESARLTKQINSLLTAARYGTAASERTVDLRPTEVVDLVEASLECFRPTLELDFDLKVHVSRELPSVLADRQAIVQVMENIVDNAIKYSTRARVLDIAASVDGRFVKVSFGDHGIGIAADELNRVFERFYRGKNAKEGGSGLGLAIAQRILRAHRGKITLHSRPNVGTEVNVFLQIAKPAA